ncbi:transcription factor YdeB [Peribacillus psychrosaccharolyticus]|uniref:Transcription factor YdeB n=1 Tax=Peribacillus psychrosaccharolyticus TaxID=1407 RepID=A0A974S0G7_PERPY|nr:CarD family transcriptional regulator [Peribacillus psychrosaccharolyticus]MEC2056376.1 CarD family transcriptional regulator [Peribacillus psychrosaccharolyticus]MED3743778.1 CarD family transcriptional regulator [Peribacillus psychrosaccharolyticus]QQT00461.1 transcription factor YdeB [Peribacillus psychrosaccharolyticus]
MGVRYLFQIGDQIVYPMHGAGIIESIEDKEIQGKVHQYYVLQLPNKMQVMLPVGKIKNFSIRKVVDTLTLENVLHLFHNGETDRTLNFKERYKSNMEKMKTGKIQEGAEVLRDLMRMNKEKTLNSSEKSMLGNARKFLSSELGLINGITEDQAIDLLNYRIGK